MIHRIDRCPSPARGLRKPAFAIAHFDVLRLAFLLLRVFGFVAAGHSCKPSQKEKVVGLVNGENC